MPIRHATVADSTAILECLRLAFDPYRESYTPPAFADTILSAATIRQRLTHMRVLVCESNSGEIVGAIAFQVIDGQEGHLRGMAVRPDHLGGGSVQQLLDRAKSELTQLDCSRITLDTTEPLTRAIRFYERNGFRRSSVVRDFFGMRLIEYVKSVRGYC